MVSKPIHWGHPPNGPCTKANIARSDSDKL
jgi:hypothetical protein